MQGDDVHQGDAETFPAFSTTEEIIADIRDGKMVIIVDDESRENEGDLIMAAARVKPDNINYMARYGRGLICLTLTKNRCTRLFRSALTKRRRFWMRYAGRDCWRLLLCSMKNSW